LRSGLNRSGGGGSLFGFGGLCVANQAKQQSGSQACAERESFEMFNHDEGTP
jgi:hypothetical protein